MATFPRLALPLVVLMATMGSFACQETALSDYIADPNSPQPADAEYLFTQAAANATVQLLNDTDCNLLITFNGAQKYTTWFTDRPNRLAGWTSTSEFVDDFDTTFDGSAPNAVIYAPSYQRRQPKDGSVAAASDTDFPLSVPVTLCSAEYDPDSEALSYTARLLSFYPPGIGSPALGNVTLTPTDLSELADELTGATLQSPSVFIDGVVAYETKFCFTASGNITESVRLTTTIEDEGQWKMHKAIKSKRLNPQTTINGQVVSPTSTYCTSLFVDANHARVDSLGSGGGAWFHLTVTGTQSNVVYQQGRFGYVTKGGQAESRLQIDTSMCTSPVTQEAIDCPFFYCANSPQCYGPDPVGALCDGAAQSGEPLVFAAFTYQWVPSSCSPGISSSATAAFGHVSVGIIPGCSGIKLVTGGRLASATAASNSFATSELSNLGGVGPSDTLPRFCE